MLMHCTADLPQAHSRLLKIETPNFFQCGAWKCGRIKGGLTPKASRQDPLLLNCILAGHGSIYWHQEVQRSDSDHVGGNDLSPRSSCVDPPSAAENRAAITLCVA
ncbi:hypothetical protein M378DRAFT_166956 [Amanita muscaria Koide BX008]|uniref:Uncharacterized protein n=1 Tax=Amanita muscaria (strain Koide BX008) TaxID=946122 RepID=A0A0C2WIY7_AMAMK|nr:hypothetical protein M378DRAFT_166956 [Amanita muscaria Koide BX008]